MANNERPLPSHALVIILTVFYLLAQLSFFMITITSMPIIKDTLDMSTPFRATYAALADKYNWYASILSGIIQFVCIIVVSYLFTGRRWPTLITTITMIVNLIICALSCAGLYILDLRNIYFTFQVTFLIPIISIFLSSVFLIDDTVDLLRGKYEMHISNTTRNVQEKLVDRQEKRQKKAKGTLRAAQNPNAEVIRVPRQEMPLRPAPQPENPQVHAQEIANAAELAVPNINKQ